MKKWTVNKYLGVKFLNHIDKTKVLETLNSDMKDFFTKYFEKETPLVYGDGQPNSKIVLIGEAPGKNEIEQGKPFVGQAGKNLQEFMEILGIRREDIYITNIVKFRPCKISDKTGRISNRAPTKEEIRTSEPFVKKEIGILEPKLIVSLGNVPLKSLIGDESATIGEYHGKPININFIEKPIVLFPLYHPASIIYRAELKSVYIEDLHKLKKYIISN